MITAESDTRAYLTRFSNGTYDGFADTIHEKGGGERGFRPHDLLEAALASCINMTVRMYADKHRIRLEGVTTKVSLNRDTEGEARFEYHLEFLGELEPDQKERLFKVAEQCPVRKTLSRTIAFGYLSEEKCDM